MKKLIQIQKDLKAPKGQFNAFGKYKYRSCEDILEAVKPLLNGAILTLTDEIVEVGGRVYVKATATISDADNVIAVSAYARESETRKGMDDSQITGASSSYARKYALNGLFLIDDTKDADHDTTQAVSYITESQVADITALLDEIKPDMKKFLKWLKVDTIEGIVSSDYTKAVKALESKRTEEGK